MSELREAIARAGCGADARRTWPHAAPDVIDNWVNQSCRSFFDEADAALSAIEARGMVVGPRETYLAPDQAELMERSSAIKEELIKRGGLKPRPRSEGQ